MPLKYSKDNSMHILWLMHREPKFNICGKSEHYCTGCHQGTSLPVGQHFQQPGHYVSDFVFTPVEKIYSNKIFVRKAREKNLINTLDLIVHCNCNFNTNTINFILYRAKTMPKAFQTKYYSNSSKQTESSCS